MLNSPYHRSFNIWAATARTAVFICGWILAGLDVAEADAPAVDAAGVRIAAHSPVASPGDSLVVVGPGVGSSRFTATRGGEPIKLPSTPAGPDRAWVHFVLAGPDQSGSQLKRDTWTLTAHGKDGSEDHVTINAAEVWWHWPPRLALPARDDAAPASGGSTTLAIFGRALTSESADSTAEFLNPAGRWRPLTIESASPNTLRVSLPLDELTEGGRLRLRVRNGSETVHEFASHFDLPLVAGEKRMDFIDISLEADESLDRAIRRVLRDGPASPVTLRLPAGVHRLEGPIDLPGDRAVVLQGRGAVALDPESPPAAGVADAAFANGTVLLFSSKEPGDTAIRLAGPGSAVEHVTVFGDGVPGSCLTLAGPDQTIRHCKFYRIEPEETFGTVILDSPGSAGLRVLDSEVHGFSRAIKVERGTNDVRVARCTLRGWYNRGHARVSNLFDHRGGRRALVEDCDIAAMDRRGGRIACRGVLFNDASARHMVVQNNRFFGLGPNPHVPDIDMNTLEPIMFHVTGRLQQRLFTIKSADQDKVTFEEQVAIQPRGGDWIAFVAEGSATGAWRPLSAAEGHTVTTIKPWRSPPKPGDKVVLQQAARENLILNNTLVADPITTEFSPEQRTRWASGPITFWFSAVDNVVAHNRFTGLSGHCFIAAHPFSVTAWNNVHHNESTVAAPTSGFVLVGYTPDSTPPASAHAWGVGNRFADNLVLGADARSPLILRMQQTLATKDDTSWILPGGGMQMTTVENNRFLGFRGEAEIDGPVNGLLFRHNAAERSAGGASSPSVWRLAPRSPLVRDLFRQATENDGD